MAHHTLTIFRKEVLETLRDKRTLLPMILIPMFFYPALILIVAQVAAVQMATLESEEGQIAMVGDSAPEALLLALDNIDNIETIEISREDSHQALEALNQQEIQAVVVLENDFSNALSGGRTGTISLDYDASSERSVIARDRVLKALEEYSDGVLEQRLVSLSLDREAIVPMEITLSNVASPARMGGYLLGQILPLLVLITVVVGAFYPAVDLTAGEKERGTLQTLLTAPVSPTEIVTGKFLAVCAITFIAGTVNIGSVVLFFGHSQFLGMTAIPSELHLSLSATTWGLLLFTVVVMGLFFSAVLMSIAVLARGFKEAQTYLTPVYFACLIPAMLAQLPGMELNGASAWVPGMNVTLLMRELLVEQVSGTNFLLVVTANLLYTAIALYVAAIFFRRESVLLGDNSPVAPAPSKHGEPFALRPWPTVAEGLAFFAILFPLVYYVGSALQQWHLTVGLLLTLWGVLLGGALVFLHRRQIERQTAFSLYRAPTTGWIAAILCGVCAWPIALFLVNLVHADALPKEMIDQANAMLAAPDGLWQLLLLDFALTLTPAICEELVFRGVLLNAFGRSMNRVAAIVIVAALFAALHFSIYRFIGTFALGIVAGAIVICTGSVLPAILFHATHNAILISISRLPMEWQTLIVGTEAPARELLLLSCVLFFVVGWLLWKASAKRVGWQPVEPKDA